MVLIQHFQPLLLLAVVMGLQGTKMDFLEVPAAADQALITPEERERQIKVMLAVLAVTAPEVAVAVEQRQWEQMPRHQ
jgi:hypothetical protein